MVRIADLRRLGAFDSGDMAWSSAGWSPSGRMGGHVTFRVHADRDDRGRALHLSIASAGAAGGAPGQTIELTFTLPHFGGVRWWARCSCGRRVGTLFIVPTQAGYRCRRCAGLSYASQREKAPGRLLRRAEKLRVRLGEGGLWPIERARRSPRPKWMRRATYRRLRAEIERLDSEAITRAVFG